MAAGVTISLASNKSGDRRVIEIAAGKPVQIGRSSKSGFKGLYASSTNALFDCAVVSRDHAELAMTSPWHGIPPRVTITDKGSLHGTTVNGRKLENGAPFDLHTGDVIELGEKITRGEGKRYPHTAGTADDKLHYTNTHITDAHEGVSLTFKRYEPEHYRPTSPSPVMNRGYQVPDSPEQEASDYDSNIDLESLYDYANQQSSAKTTPEQPKHKSGTQKSPINLEGAAGPSIVDLSQDDDELVVMPAAHKGNESIVIAETYDEEEELLVPESVPVDTVVEAASANAENLADQDIADSDAYDIDDDVESVRMHNTGLCQILMGQDGATSDIENREHEDDDEAEDSEDKDVEYGYESIDDADEQSDGADSDLNNYDSEPESNVEEPSELYSSTHLQQESPEPDEPQQPIKTSTIHSVLAAEQPKPKAQYDPVRSSQQSATGGPFAAASMPSASAYVYGYPGYGSYEMPATDFSDSSRWDMQPATIPYASQFGSQQYYPAPYGAAAATPFGGSFTAPTMFDAPQQSATFAAPSNVDQSRPQSYTNPFMPAQMPAQMRAMTADTPAQAITDVSPSKVAGKIAITDIVDEQPHLATEAADETSAMLAEAEKMVAAANADDNSAGFSNSTKRKANDLETVAMTETPQQPTKKSKQEVTDKDSASRAPARRTKSRSTVRRVATSAAQYATAAAFGGAATIAFLSSPYAQSLIDFLG